jgi:hypothetical protein
MLCKEFVIDGDLLCQTGLKNDITLRKAFEHLDDALLFFSTCGI